MSAPANSPPGSTPLPTNTAPSEEPRESPREQSPCLGLSLTATPIGNLGDLTDRARQRLREADIIAAEDTRRTRKLLSSQGIPSPTLVSYNKDNEKRQLPWLLTQISQGKHVVLVSDAGSPAIADPGETLVRACAEQNLPVEVVPGPSAVIAALSLSGLPTGRFVFESFLPRKAGERKRRMESLAQETRTMIFLESPTRLFPALSDMRDIFGAERPCAVCRELTKIHEEVRRGSLEKIAASFAEGTKGEVVIVVGGAPPVTVSSATLVAHIREFQREGLSTKEIATRVAADLGVAKNRAYQAAIEVGNESTPSDPAASFPGQSETVTKQNT